MIGTTSVIASRTSQETELGKYVQIRTAFNTVAWMSLCMYGSDTMIIVSHEVGHCTDALS